MEAAKDKRKNTKPTLDFISPYSLEMCVNLLNRQRGKVSYWPISKRFSAHTLLVIDMIPIDEDTYEFAARWEDKAAYFRPYVSAKGYLKRWERTTTQVTTNIEFSGFYASCLVVCVLALIVMVVIAVMILASRGTGGLLGLLFLLLTGSVAEFAFGLMRLRHKLVSIIEKTLQGIPEPVVNNSMPNQ